MKNKDDFRTPFGDLGGKSVAVYGSLRKGMHNSGILSEHKTLSTERVNGFGMVSFGSYPGAYRSNDHSIVVEIYKPKDKSIDARLDSLESYPRFYDRMLVETSVGDAWLYFIKTDKGPVYPFVEGGDWVEYYSDKRGTHFGGYFYPR